MLLGWIDLIRRPLTKRNDFVSVDARGHSENSPKNYEMITSPPTTSGTPKAPNPIVTSPRSDHEGLSPLPQSPPSPSSQYTNDYLNKETDGNNKSPQLSFSQADYKSPKLSFSTPRPPSAGRSFSRDSYGRSYQPTMMQMGGTTSPGPGRPLSPPTRRESGGSTFSSAYDWDPATTYAPSSARVLSSSSYGRSDAYRL